MKESLLEPVAKRLRGGAKEDSITLMIRQAIESAAKHGIKLIQGVRNNADGNCQYESVLNNINYRSCFDSKLSQHPNDYRYKWVSELENAASIYPDIAPGYCQEEKSENWNKLKRPFVYEVPYFGDFVMHGIARGCKKDILIFNTSPEAWDPIYVIKASRFGGQTDSDIPVVLAYNQRHYESLHPQSVEDINKTKDLINAFTNGNYMYAKKDIPYLIEISKEPTPKLYDDRQYEKDFSPLNSSGNSKNSLNRNKCDTKSPPLKPSNCRTSIAKKICELSLEEIRMIPVKKRSTEEKKQYNHLMYLKNKKNNVVELSNTDERVSQCTLTLEELKDIPVKERSKVETKRYNQLVYQNRKALQLDVISNDEISKSQEEKHDYIDSSYDKEFPPLTTEGLNIRKNSKDKCKTQSKQKNKLVFKSLQSSPLFPSNDVKLNTASQDCCTIQRNQVSQLSLEDLLKNELRRKQNSIII